MYLQGYTRWIFFIYQKESGFDFCLQILEVIGSFVFNVRGAPGVGIGNGDMGWKVGSESYLLKVIRSACNQISLIKTLCNRPLLFQS